MGNSARIDALIRFLTKHYQVIVFFVGRSDFMKREIEATYSIKIISQYSKRFNFIGSISDRAEKFTRKVLNETSYKKFNTIVQNFNPEILLIEYIFNSNYLIQLPLSFKNNLLKIIDTHNFLSLKQERLKGKGLPYDQNITPNKEKEAVNHFDIIIAIQKKEVVIFQQLAPTKTVCLGTHAISPFPAEISRPLSSKLKLGYISPNTVKNRLSLNWFLSNIWQIYFSKNPTIELIIGGEISHFLKERKDNISNVRSIGWVKHKNDFYQQIDIFINPDQAGAGLKIKNVEALANACPLVTTSIGAEGIEDSQGLIICDSVSEWVNVIELLIIDSKKRKIMANNAYKYAQANFSESNAFKALQETIQNYLNP